MMVSTRFSRETSVRIGVFVRRTAKLRGPESVNVDTTMVRTDFELVVQPHLCSKNMGFRWL